MEIKPGLKCRISYYPSESGLITEYFGTVDNELLINSNQIRYRIFEKYSIPAYMLVDYTASEKISFSTEIVRTSAVKATDISHETNTECHVAAVLPTTVGYGLGRIYQAYANSMNWSSKIFSAREEAEAWLRENVDPDLKFADCPDPIVEEI